MPGMYDTAGGTIVRERDIEEFQLEEVSHCSPALCILVLGKDMNAGGKVKARVLGIMACGMVRVMARGEGKGVVFGC